VWRLTLCGLRRSEIMGLKWDAVDLDRGEVKIEAGRVLLDGHRTATDDPKSRASQRSVPVEDIQLGTVALLRSLRPVRPLTGSLWDSDTKRPAWCWWIRWESLYGLSCTPIVSGGCPSRPGYG
jgi:integrase